MSHRHLAFLFIPLLFIALCSTRCASSPEETTQPVTDSSPVLGTNLEISDQELLDYATALPNETLAVVQIVSEGQGVLLDAAQMTAYQSAIRYFIFRASSGQVVISSTTNDQFGPIDVSAAFPTSCSGVDSVALFNLLNAQLPTLASYRRVILLHNSACPNSASMSGSSPNPGSSFLYLRARQSIPLLAGEEASLPGISKILAGLLTTYNSTYPTLPGLANDGAYVGSWNFLQQGPGTLVNYTMNTHPYSIMGDISLLPGLHYTVKYPSPANLELAGWLDSQYQIVHYTQSSGNLTVQLHNYLRSRQVKVIKINYAAAPASMPFSAYGIYIYYNSAAQKVILDYGPFASAFGTLSTSQYITALNVQPGQSSSVTLMNIPLLNQQPVTVEINSVSPALDYVVVSVHP